MPTLLEERVITLEFADLFKRVPVERPGLPHPRYKGVHQSGILRVIAETIGKLKPGEELESDMPWIMAAGLMWEEFAASLYPDMDWQPGEMVVDEIAVNCDGISTLEGRSVVDEFKATYKKVRTGEEFLEEWMWMHQCRAYCYCYGPRLVRWHILYIKGDYVKFGPLVKEYLVEFTDKEVEQTWNMLKKNRHRAVPES